MAWPSSSARTKNWGTEVLTDGDLEGQFDLLHTYLNDSLNGTTGHDHSGGTAEGPLISLTGSVTGVLDETNGGTGQSTITQGDILYGSASNTLSKLAAGTSGYLLKTQGAGANPTWVAPRIFGTLDTSTYSSGNSYQASGDLWVIAKPNASGITITILSDSADPPTTVLAADTSTGGSTTSIIAPVKSGDYFKVTSTGTAPTVYVRPLA